MDHKHLPIATLLLFAIGTDASAQSFAVQVTALTPLTAQVTSGTQSSSQNLPAGPLAPSGSVFASISGGGPFVSSRFSWATESTNTYASLDVIATMISVGNPPSASASFGSHELLVEFQPTGAPAAVLEITRTWTTPNGPLSTVEIDLNNDGSIDLSGPVGTFTIPIAAGQVSRARIIMAGTLPVGLLSSMDQLHLEVRPSNAVFVAQTVGQCMNWGPSLEIEETFSNQGIVISSQSVTPFGVMVIGFTPIVAPLPIVSPLPCILLPNPDFVLLLPQFSTVTLPIALPPAVRPVTLFVQSIAISDLGELLGLTPGYTVIAQ